MSSIGSHVKGLIFDCDGTIADTMPAHYEAWLKALKEHSKDFSEALFYELAGVPSAKIVELLNERHGYNLPVHETVKIKEKLFEGSIPKVLPIEPVVKLVHEYAGKLPMAVATGGTRAICTKTLQSLQLIQHFQSIVTADDVAHGKPAPDIFLEAARRIGVAPNLCCAFEDGELGIQSAKAAGMQVIDIRPMRQKLP